MTADLTRKIQTTKDEFIRQIAGAAGGMGYSIQGNDVLLGKNGRSIKIHVTDLGVEEKGSLELPMQRVEFDFRNMSEPDIEAFLKIWDQHHLRMGG